MSHPVIIAFLTSQYGRACDTFIRDEVTELRLRGHTVHTFSIRRPADSHMVSEEVATERRQTDYILEAGLWKLGTALAILAFVHPRRVVRTLHLAWRTRRRGFRRAIHQGAYVLEAAHLARRMKATGVMHLHNHIAENSATVAMLASELSGIPYSIKVHGPQIFFAPEEWALGEKIQRSAFTACITDFCRSQCLVFTPRQMWHKVKVVRSGLGEAFVSGRISPIPKKPRIVCIGRLCNEKGQLVLLEAAKKLLGEGVDLEVTLIGDGPLRDALDAYTERWGLQGQIHFMGWQSSSVVHEILLASRGLVVASFSEGLPGVIQESLAVGRPVISTCIAGIPELVKPGENGWLVPAGSVDDLADALRDLLTAPIERLEAMGQRGADLARQEHDIRKQMPKLEELICAALAPTRAGMEQSTAEVQTA